MEIIFISTINIALMTLHRFLTFPSVSLNLLMIIAARAALSKTAKRGLWADIPAQESCKRLLHGLCKRIGDADFTVVLGTIGVVTGGLYMASTIGAYLLCACARVCPFIALSTRMNISS